MHHDDVGFVDTWAADALRDAEHQWRHGEIPVERPLGALPLCPGQHLRIIDDPGPRYVHHVHVHIEHSGEPVVRAVDEGVEVCLGRNIHGVVYLYVNRQALVVWPDIRQQVRRPVLPDKAADVLAQRIILQREVAPGTA